MTIPAPFSRNLLYSSYALGMWAFVPTRFLEGVGNVDLSEWEYVNIARGKVMQPYPYHKKQPMGLVELSSPGSPRQDLQIVMLWFPRAPSISCNWAPTLTGVLKRGSRYWVKGRLCIYSELLPSLFSHFPHVPWCPELFLSFSTRQLIKQVLTHLTFWVESEEWEQHSSSPKGWICVNPLYWGVFPLSHFLTQWGIASYFCLSENNSSAMCNSRASNQYFIVSYRDRASCVLKRWTVAWRKSRPGL